MIDHFKSYSSSLLVGSWNSLNLLREIITYSEDIMRPIHGSWRQRTDKIYHYIMIPWALGWDLALEHQMLICGLFSDKHHKSQSIGKKEQKIEIMQCHAINMAPAC